MGGYFDYLARKEHYGWLVFDTKNHTVEKADYALVEELESKNYSIKKFDNPFIDGALTAPIKLFINVSNHCNLECVHCFSDSSPHHKEFISLNKMIELISEASEMGVFLIIIGGGEPFMRPDIWEIISFIHSKGMGISLTTNGTILSEEIIDNIKRYHDRLRACPFLP